jgi:anaerobic selenocysteine-containing dehydrogenase
MKESNIPRRQFLKFGAAALAMIPVIVASGRADAATNDAMRTALKYQDKPQDGKNCAGCMHFVPSASAKAQGSCKIIPNDTEISAQGYCMGWAKKA